MTMIEFTPYLGFAPWVTIRRLGMKGVKELIQRRLAGHTFIEIAGDLRIDSDTAGRVFGYCTGFGFKHGCRDRKRSIDRGTRAALWKCFRNRKRFVRGIIDLPVKAPSRCKWLTRGERYGTYYRQGDKILVR